MEKRMSASQAHFPLCLHDWQTYELLYIPIDNIKSVEPKTKRGRGDFTLITANLGPPNKWEVQEEAAAIMHALFFFDPDQARIIAKQSNKPTKV